MSTRTRTARITSVAAVHDFILRPHFDDGTTREIDLEAELWGPMFEPLHRNPELFRQVRVDKELGTIVWPNGADMDPDVLHGDYPATPRSESVSSRQVPEDAELRVDGSGGETATLGRARP